VTTGFFNTHASEICAIGMPRDSATFVPPRRWVGRS
jgi:hypothetical protein